MKGVRQRFDGFLIGHVQFANRTRPISKLDTSDAIFHLFLYFCTRNENTDIIFIPDAGAGGAGTDGGGDGDDIHRCRLMSRQVEQRARGDNAVG